MGVLSQMQARPVPFTLLEGHPVVRRPMLMSQHRSFTPSPERGSQKRAILKFAIKIITKVIVLLVRLIGHYLGDFASEVGSYFEKLKILHESLKASDGLIGKAYCYLLNYLSKKMKEFFELIVDALTKLTTNFAKSTKLFQYFASMSEKYWGKKDANSKEEATNSKEEKEGEENSKKEEEENSKEKEGKKEEQFKKEEHKESNQEEKNPNKKGRILIELYDLEKIDDILKSEVWQTIKSSNVGAVKIEKRD